jgi:hypothetical protein
MIWEQQLHTQPLWWIEQLKIIFEKINKQEKIQKMSYTRSAFLVNPTTHKISIEKVNKIKRRRSRIPNPKFRYVFEVPEDSLNCYPM